MRVLTDVTGENLRRWREAKGWDVPRMARELRKVARDSGEDVAAHHGLLKMIPQWERGNRAPRERYRLLYLKIFADIAGGLSPGMAAGGGGRRRPGQAEEDHDAGRDPRPGGGVDRLLAGGGRQARGTVGAARRRPP